MSSLPDIEQVAVAIDLWRQFDAQRGEPGENTIQALAEAVAAASSFDATDLQNTTVTFMSSVQDALESGACRDRRVLHRRWIVGLILGLERRGYDLDEVAYIIAYIILCIAVERGMILAVVAHSVAWSFGNVHRRLGWDEDLKGRLQAALARGLTDAEVHLGSEVEQHVSRWMRENLVRGWRAGEFWGRLARR